MQARAPFVIGGKGVRRLGVAPLSMRLVDVAPTVAALLGCKPLEPGGIDGVYAVYGPAGLLAMAEDREGEARSLCVLTQG